VFNIHEQVLYLSTETGSESEELAKDLLAITTVFVARNNGLCASQNRKRYREAEREHRQTEMEETEIES
jgi:predicted site-specific integrase-resolvase